MIMLDLIQHALSDSFMHNTKSKYSPNIKSKYSLDLALAHFFLFLKVKIPTKGYFFHSILDIQKAVKNELRAIPVMNYSCSFDDQYDHSHTCRVLMQ